VINLILIAIHITRVFYAGVNNLFRARVTLTFFTHATKLNV